ncbi:MAG: VWA domain-containing protein [Gammaproteobacteria bacterium]|nr:VWA domain-containing protein [Gammaproteobacteria bacterium]MCY4283238.1 VWA domain-containing protein [Gammaproteobacteria bacterium]MCY4338627.1 VWA domain-containing protein [Gammaproteobacteria bacterium]
MRNRRLLTPLSLSFLDIMSCGFGSAALLFLIIKHNVDTNVLIPVASREQTSEVMLLEEEILEGRQNLAKTRNTISEVNEELVMAQGMARRIMTKIEETRTLIEQLSETTSSVELDQLKLNIKQLEQQKQQLQQDLQDRGNDVRRLVGDGNREYLTGLKLDGKRILILLDVSGSMLDDTIVNIIRFRNMRDGLKRNAPKWVQTLRMVDWLTARLPRGSQYQIYVFNTDTRALLPGLAGKWLDVNNKTELDSMLEALGRIVPEGGTNLERAFAAISKLRPKPDNVYLITDGLPTQGSKRVRGATITGKQRLDLFTRAVTQLPGGVPLNVILAPMEGDPAAAFAFWRLAMSTNGAFLIPSEDWP